MANLTKTKHLFGFTSPRSIEKIIPEIDLLVKNFLNEEWSGNEQLQRKYFDILFKSDFYEGDKYPSNPSLAARDRITRAPKSLGFIDLKPKIALTEVGIELLKSKRPHEIITKQLLKFQLPSPFHLQSKKQDFFVKPYLELLRLINDVGSLSKTEVALFFLQLTHIDKYEIILSKIFRSREKIKEFKGSRKLYYSQCFQKEIMEIFDEEIKSTKLKTRESSELSMKKFVATKRSNMFDYADAFIRYIRATQLVTFEKRTFRLIISPSKYAEARFILEKVPREPYEFRTLSDFKEYLFSAGNIKLLTDNRQLLIDKLQKMSVSFDEDRYSVSELKDLLEEAESKLLSEKIDQTSIQLKDFREYDHILETFQSILRKESPDPSLFLEWNVWRSFVMLNYAKRVQGNFIMDHDGMPLNTAPGMKPDIEIDYQSFSLIIEVTLSTGQKQYEMEGEPVARHFGRAKESLNENLYCIFIAPQISDGTLSHYFNLNRMTTKYYGGKTRIIPMTILNYISFLEIGKRNNFNEPEKLELWLKKLWDINQKCDDETIWFSKIQDSVAEWAS